MTLRDLFDFVTWSLAAFALGRLWEERRIERLLDDFADEQTRKAWAAFRVAVGGR